MRIFASDNSNHTVLDYLGEDLWIKCYILKGNDNLGKYYIRPKDTFVSATTDDIILNCNMVDSKDIEEGEYCSKYSYTREQICERCVVKPEWVHLVEPIVILTDEELMAKISNIGILSKFVGKDYWIKVYRDGHHNDFDTFFLHINSRDGYRIVGDWIEAAYVDDYRYNGTYSGPPSKFVEPIGISYRDIRDFEVVQPMQVLTPADMNDLLVENDAIFEEGYRNDEGEDYEW